MVECQLLPLARPVRTVQNGPTTLIDFQTKTTCDLSRPRFTTTLDKRLSGATIRRPEPSAWANLLFDHVPAEGLELGPAWPAGTRPASLCTRARHFAHQASSSLRSDKSFLNG